MPKNNTPIAARAGAGAVNFLDWLGTALHDQMRNFVQQGGYYGTSLAGGWPAEMVAGMLYPPPTPGQYGPTGTPAPRMTQSPNATAPNPTVAPEAISPAPVMAGGVQGSGTSLPAIIGQGGGAAIRPTGGMPTAMSTPEPGAAPSGVGFNPGDVWNMIAHPVASNTGSGLLSILTSPQFREALAGVGMAFSEDENSYNLNRSLADRAAGEMFGRQVQGNIVAQGGGMPTAPSGGGRMAPAPGSTSTQAATGGSALPSRRAPQGAFGGESPYPFAGSDAFISPAALASFSPRFVTQAIETGGQLAATEGGKFNAFTGRMEAETGARRAGVEESRAPFQNLLDMYQAWGLSPEGRMDQFKRDMALIKAQRSATPSWEPESHTFGDRVEFYITNKYTGQRYRTGVVYDKDAVAKSELEQRTKESSSAASMWDWAAQATGLRALESNQMTQLDPAQMEQYRTKTLMLYQVMREAQKDPSTFDQKVNAALSINVAPSSKDIPGSPQKETADKVKGYINSTFK